MDPLSSRNNLTSFTSLARTTPAVTPQVQDTPPATVDGFVASAPSTRVVRDDAASTARFEVAPSANDEVFRPAVTTPPPPPPTVLGLQTGETSVPGVLTMGLDGPTPQPETSSLDKFLTQFIAAGSDKGQLRESMLAQEKHYLQRSSQKDSSPAGRAKHQEMLHRYGDSRVTPERVHELHAKFAAERGVDVRTMPPDIVGAAFDAGSAEALKKHGDKLADAFFASEKASLNPEKCQLLKEQSSRFIDLLQQAKAEGDLPESVTAADIYQLMASNMSAVAVQDRAASENVLGDHGVRHLIGHNIRVCETMADEMVKNGGKVSAKDRLIMHQAMLVHDIGYSTQNVRGDINFNGIKGQDAGHPLLGGRYVRERSLDPSDPLAKIFSPDDLEIMHRCVMYHDKDKDGGPGLQFTMGQELTKEQRAMNLESFTRLADNTHAFDDKLPEVLYRNPKTLVAMRLMKTAAEIDDQATTDKLRTQVSDQIAARDDLSADDKDAMKMAMRTFNPQEMFYLINRTVGNEPTYAMDQQGKVHLGVQESAIHPSLVEISGSKRFGLLSGWVKDLSGVKLSEIDPRNSHIDTDNVTFTLTLGPNRSKQLTPFQQEVSKLCIEDRNFSAWAIKDASLGKKQKAVSGLIEGAKAMLKSGDDEAFREVANTYVDVTPEQSTSEVLSSLRDRLDELKGQRKRFLHSMLNESA